MVTFSLHRVLTYDIGEHFVPFLTIIPGTMEPFDGSVRLRSIRLTVVSFLISRNLPSSCTCGFFVVWVCSEYYDVDFSNGAITANIVKYVNLLCIKSGRLANTQKYMRLYCCKILSCEKFCCFLGVSQNPTYCIYFVLNCSLARFN